MIRLLRLIGWTLAFASALSFLLFLGVLRGFMDEGGSMGIVTLLLGGAVSFAWQSLAGAALAALCFAAARLLDASSPDRGR